MAFVAFGALLPAPWTAAEERAAGARLLEARRTGDVTALRRVTRDFVAHNLGLVVTLAAKFRDRGLEFEDLVQEGSVGLLRAVEDFDPARNLRFSTYATWWIRHHVQRAAGDLGRTIRVPAGLQDKRHRVVRARDAHHREFYGGEPNEEQIAAASGETIRTVHAVRVLAELDTTSFDATRLDGDQTLHDVVPGDVPLPSELAVARERATAARALLDELPERERQIMTSRFNDDELTLADVGRSMSLSRERVRQLQNQALEAMRAGAARRRLDP